MIGIINGGFGNLGSVSRALNHLKTNYELINQPFDLTRYRAIILPGVGAFKSAMDQLHERKLDRALIEYAQTGKPILGICLGMQLLMSKSMEFGETKGLDLIKGRVLPLEKEENKKIPQVGWNGIKDQFQGHSIQWKGSILKDIPIDSEVYFTHSFYVSPKTSEDTLASSHYGSQEFCSVVQKGSIFGCQFHPEKSGKIGLKILENFLSLSTL